MVLSHMTLSNLERSKSRSFILHSIISHKGQTIGVTTFYLEP